MKFPKINRFLGYCTAKCDGWKPTFRSTTLLLSSTRRILSSPPRNFLHHKFKGRTTKWGNKCNAYYIPTFTL